MKNIAYKLNWDKDHLIDSDFDASLVRFKGSEETTRLMSSRELNLPDKIYFEAFFDTLFDVDYPISNVNWPIMSNKMYKLITGFKPIAHKKIPLIMLDASFSSKTRFDADGQPNPGVANYDYVAIQLLDPIDVFDWDKSIYKQNKMFPDKVSLIQKLVLKEPEGGFPPLFRLKASRASLFVSSEAKQALENSGIRGIIYTETEN